MHNRFTSFNSLSDHSMSAAEKQKTPIPLLVNNSVASSGARGSDVDSQWNPLYKHFIESVLVETKQLAGSNSNVILTRQTCGQHSSMSAGSKRRAPGNCLFVQIWYMFLSSNCTGDSDLLIFKSVYFLDIFV